MFFENTKGIQRKYAAREARRGKKLVPRGRFSKIQRGYKGNTRRAKRAAGKLFLGVVFRKYEGNTKEIHGARSAPRKESVPRGRFPKIQREYKGNARRAKRAAENWVLGGHFFGISKVIIMCSVYRPLGFDNKRGNKNH